MIGLQGYGNSSDEEDFVEKPEVKRESDPISPKDVHSHSTHSTHSTNNINNSSGDRADGNPPAICSDASRLTNQLPMLNEKDVKVGDEDTIRQYLAAQRDRSFDLQQDIRNKKDFGNPILLTKVVEYFNIQERGSNL
jgi:hypothetical protein